MQTQYVYITIVSETIRNTASDKLGKVAKFGGQKYANEKSKLDTFEEKYNFHFFLVI